jgi:hypothetical protein
MENTFDLLSNIKEVDASSILFNRIQLKIEIDKKNHISTPWMLSIAATIFILCCFNIFTVAKKTKVNEVLSIAKNMNLLNNDNFYNEQ